MNITQPHSLIMHLVRFRYILYLVKFPKKLYFCSKSLRSRLCNHHQSLESLSFKVRAEFSESCVLIGPVESLWQLRLQVLLLLFVNERNMGFMALTNSEFNLFFKASTVISLQTTTASRTPSDESEYILTLFQLGSHISQYFEMLLGHVQLCGLVSYYYVTLPLLKSLSLLKFVYFHFCILIKY